MTRFRNAHAVESYLGLTPGESSSSERKQHTGITKAGATEVRRALVQAACVVQVPDDPAARSVRITDRFGNEVTASIP